MTFEVARRLVKRGDSVEWFSASFPGAKREETIDGVRIVRSGQQWTVHMAAFGRYRKNLDANFDVVIDEVNTVPFFTPIWADIPIVMFIHQLARDVWWYESSFPLSVLGFITERPYLRVYRRVAVVTVSESTKHDLKQLGFKGPIAVVPQGLEQIDRPTAVRPAWPRFLYVGRLAPSKRPTDIIRAFATFCRTVESAELRILGEGTPRYVSKLHRLASELGVSDRIGFLGRVSTLEKHSEMATAHVLLLASVREGWGLVVTEANAFGTPAIAYRVRGLCDSIRDNETGLLVEPTPDALAEGMSRLWGDRVLYRRLSEEAERWSTTFSFERTASAFREQIAALLSREGINPRPEAQQ